MTKWLEVRIALIVKKMLLNTKQKLLLSGGKYLQLQYIFHGLVLTWHPTYVLLLIKRKFVRFIRSAAAVTTTTTTTLLIAVVSFLLLLLHQQKLAVVSSSY